MPQTETTKCTVQTRLTRLQTWKRRCASGHREGYVSSVSRETQSSPVMCAIELCLWPHAWRRVHPDPMTPTYFFAPANADGTVFFVRIFLRYKIIKTQKCQKPQKPVWRRYDDGMPLARSILLTFLVKQRSQAFKLSRRIAATAHGILDTYTLDGSY